MRYRNCIGDSDMKVSSRGPYGDSRRSSKYRGVYRVTDPKKNISKYTESI